MLKDGLQRGRPPLKKSGYGDDLLRLLQESPRNTQISTDLANQQIPAFHRGSASSLHPTEFKAAKAEHGALARSPWGGQL